MNKKKTSWGLECGESEPKALAQLGRQALMTISWFQLEAQSAAVKSLGELDVFLAWLGKNHQGSSSI